ncbi:MAG: fluoride efflux transporter CrcB [Mesorhizobium sp.]|nr:MAG: fluoride efflux transporter CrcB [Mesorhizobium sp.]RWB32632.1 MAG: fluoride efflux transporter CrcB [Mesorhizobium sp.]RWB78073.1 MAG: fluoride efflux transporter CrcB [Mesorhizobium sp.]RWC28904.1 MAG: fluoride efflux transporter CrcB [Mesorhizobium sp.]RWD21339.1 MAG: fluoride efflux transporter CrcB [Mesorhizobium sp.]
MSSPRKLRSGGTDTAAAEHAARLISWRKTNEAVRIYATVAAGSMIGGVLRALASLTSTALWGNGFPFGTLLVNIVGSFLIGFYATLTAPDGRVFASPLQRQFFMTGFCGGLTTFSAFSLETLTLAQSGKLMAAALNIAISVVTWLAAVWLGHILAVRLNRLRGSRQ